MDIENQIQAAIERFREDHPDWKSQRDAFCKCDTASTIFIDWLHVHFYSLWKYAAKFDFYTNDPSKNPDQTIYDVGRNELGYSKALWHCIVELPTCFVDWTARQYTVDASYPHVIPKEPDVAIRNI